MLYGCKKKRKNRCQIKKNIEQTSAPHCLESIYTNRTKNILFRYYFMYIGKKPQSCLIEFRVFVKVHDTYYTWYYLYMMLVGKISSSWEILFFLPRGVIVYIIMVLCSLYTWFFLSHKQVIYFWYTIFCNMYLLVYILLKKKNVTIHKPFPVSCGDVVGGIMTVDNIFFLAGQFCKYKCCT